MKRPHSKKALLCGLTIALASLTALATPPADKPMACTSESETTPIKLTAAEKKAANKAFRAMGLATDEYDFPDIGISSRWDAVGARSYEGTKLVIFRQLEIANGVVSKHSDEFDVLALVDGKLLKFERAFQIPRSVVARISHAKESEIDSSSYVVELADVPSVSDALKSMCAGIKYYGFSGVVVAGGKASYDPTPGRTWRVLDPRFNLRRGSSHETGDIQAYHWDEHFEAYFNGAVHMAASTGEVGAQVLPWGQSAVVELLKTTW